MRVSEKEVMLRFAVSSIRSAQDYLIRLPHDPADDLAEAVGLMEEVLYWIHEWAEKQEIEIKDSMPT